MSFLEDMAGQVLSGGLGSNQSGGLAHVVLGMINNQPGGLGGLLQAFQNKGLGDVAGSWVGTGANQEISPDDLHNALGPEAVQQMSEQTGLPTGDLLSQLTGLLPSIVDHLTPGGQVPQGMGSLGMDMLKGLLAKQAARL